MDGSTRHEEEVMGAKAVIVNRALGMTRGIMLYLVDILIVAIVTTIRTATCAIGITHNHWGASSSY